MNDGSYVLRFSHKIIEHLGIKLYQNKPTNVIAELVSNSWDAEAKNVWIDIAGEGADRRVVVADDGHGMAPDVLKTSYLVIGKPKRSKSSPDETTQNLLRHPMGRKGIGKLAPFGIASEIQLVSVVKGTSGKLATWLRFDVEKMRSLEDEVNEDLAVYEPEVVCSEVPAEGLADIAKERGLGDVIDAFVERISKGAANGDEVEGAKAEETEAATSAPASPDGAGSAKPQAESSGTGTAIIMTKLSTTRAIDPVAVGEAMGRRFTVTLLRDDFKVRVNAKRLMEAQALPAFAFKVGEPSAPLTTTIPFEDKQLPVRYWAGFVGEAQWPQDQAGVGVYAHGKIAQDRPFAFGRKGDEIFVRYMYAVVEADWLDELPDDLISTDRTSVDWAHPQAASLLAWGENGVKEWVKSYEKFRRENDRKKAVRSIRERKSLTLSDTETEALADLLSDISPAIGNDDKVRDRAIDALAGAWVHKPMREMTKKLWDGLKDHDGTAEQFVQTIEQLRKHLVPESLSLAVTMAQRIYAISLLYRRIHEGTETDLQKLIETFPWILQPDMEKLTANQQLKTTMMRLETQGQLPVASIDAAPASALRPDFVYFSPPGELDRIVVVELKHPGREHHLTRQNELQLVTYMTFIADRYPRADIRGFLIGNNYLDMTSQNRNVEILDWSDVLTRSRRGHVELLASMLIGAHPDIHDARVAQVAQFGGTETLALLGRLAEHDEDLKDLMDAMAETKVAAQAPEPQAQTA